MTTRLSVALLSHLASRSAPTGAEFSLAILAEGLRRRGHEVHVVVPGAWSLTPRLRAAGATVHVIPCRVLWLTSYEPVGPAVTALKWLRFSLPDPGARRLRARLLELRPDAVLVNCLPHLGGAAAARAAGRPVAWFIREIMPPGGRRRLFAARLRRDARRIAAVSEATAAWLREEGLGDRCEVIPNGVAVPDEPPDAAAARRALGLPADGCMVGLFGQILPHKGVDLFLQAAAIALRSQADLRFAIAGRGRRGYVERLRRAVDGSPLAARLHWLPPQEDGRRLVEAADIVCLTTTAPDPLPRTVLEAMAARRPVAAFRSGGTPEMVGDGVTGALAEVADVPGLAAQIVRLGRDPALRRALGEAGARRARDAFSIDRHVERVERMLCEVAR